MSLVISSANDKKEFNKPLINIGTNPKCDYVINPGFDFLLTVQYNKADEICTVINNVKSPNVTYKGEILQKVAISNSCKLELKNSDEYILIQVGENISADSDYSMKVELSEEDLQELYGEDEQHQINAKIEHMRQPIEKARVAIIKQISYPIFELKSKIKTQGRTNLFLHIAMFITSILSAFAIGNYMMGLSTQEAAKHVYLATNIPSWIAFTFVVFAVALMLKQGTFLYLNEKRLKNTAASSKIARNFMIWVSALFIIAIYTVNLSYYSTISESFSISAFMTVFFVGALSATSIASGYFKENSSVYTSVLNKYEYREDFEAVTKAYRLWIERYANSLTKEKINSIKDRLFMLNCRTGIEILAGVLTAPFLAFGVSNTLAMCFPEFAGWIRVGGARFSPIFLILATSLIIFAFFMFVSAFLTEKKIKASDVIKQDGFSDYRHHGVTIYGLEAVRKLESDKKRFLAIACAIVFIEFTMNISYFMTEIGGEIQGVMLSFIAALLPTAILIAETILTASTRFNVYNCDELISKLDKE